MKQNSEGPSESDGKIMELRKLVSWDPFSSFWEQTAPVRQTIFHITTQRTLNRMFVWTKPLYKAITSRFRIIAKQNRFMQPECSKFIMVYE